MRHTRRQDPAPDPAPGQGGHPATPATRDASGQLDGPLDGPQRGDRQGWLDEAAAEVLLEGGVVVPADAWDAVNAARLAQLLAAAASVAVRRPPGAALREDAAVMAFRAARVSARGRTLRSAAPETVAPTPTSRRFFRRVRPAAVPGADLAPVGRPVAARGRRGLLRGRLGETSAAPGPSRGRAFRMSAAAAAVSVLAVGGMAVAVAGGRYVLPGDGAGSGPVSRPPAAVAADGATAGPAAQPPVTPAASHLPGTPAPTSPSAPASPTASPASPTAPTPPADLSHPAEAAPKAARKPVPALPATTCGAQRKSGPPACRRPSHRQYHKGHRSHGVTSPPPRGKHPTSGSHGGR
jgi:hypothetical protein